MASTDEIEGLDAWIEGLAAGVRAMGLLGALPDEINEMLHLAVIGKIKSLMTAERDSQLAGLRASGAVNELNIERVKVTADKLMQAKLREVSAQLAGKKEHYH